MCSPAGQAEFPPHSGWSTEDAQRRQESPWNLRGAPSDSKSREGPAPRRRALRDQGPDSRAPPTAESDPSQRHEPMDWTGGTEVSVTCAQMSDMFH